MVAIAKVSIFLVLFLYFFFYLSSIHLYEFSFFFFQGLLLCSSWMVVFSTNPIYSVLFLVLVFLNGSALLFFLQLDFLAFTFVIVYIGAIAVLFLFVVMMLNIRLLKFTFSSIHYFFASLTVLLLFFQQFFYGFSFFLAGVRNVQFTYLISWSKVMSHSTNLEIMGQFIYGMYFFDLIICSLILLVAMVGAVVLTISEISSFEGTLSAKKQSVYEQMLKDFKNVIQLR